MPYTPYGEMCNHGSILDITEFFFVDAFPMDGSTLDKEYNSEPIEDDEVWIEVKNLLGKKEIMGGRTDKDGRFYKRSSLFIIPPKAVVYVKKIGYDFGSGTSNQHLVKELMMALLPPGLIYTASSR